MNLIRNIKNTTLKLDSVITIGNFDGVHIGHSAIINKVLEIAKQKNLQSTIVTFQPHPIAIFKPQNFCNFLITSLAQKLRIFKDYSLDNVVILPFNREFADLSADDFVAEILVKRLKVKYLVIGYDFIFGKNREGNFEFLQKKAQEFGFEIFNIDALKNGEQVYSSSLTRDLIRKGDVLQASKILGKNFAVEGIVAEGKKMGAKIGFATANIAAKPHIVKPHFGVYKSEVSIAGFDKKFKSITNFGVRPTLENDATALFETHIFDFNQDIYGKKITVQLLDFVRDEKKFASLDELKQQIARDVATVSEN